MACEIEFHLDYLTFTVHELPNFKAFWAETFQKKLGDMVQVGHGGRGYKEFYTSGTGANLYTVPVNGGNYFTVELKGSACDCLTPDDIQDIMILKRGGLRVNITRIDLAFDHVPFTPEMFLEEIKLDRLTCKANRESMRVNDSFNKKQEDGGGVGCMTVYVGSPASERMLRVYNEHGFTRCELQLKDKWANNAFDLVVGSRIPDWYGAAMSVLTNFIRLNTDWWLDFVGCSVPADIRVYSARNKSLSKLETWVKKQLAPGLFTLYAVIGIDAFWGLVVSSVSSARLEKYRYLMELQGIRFANQIEPMKID